jgi:hypothetical protein
MGFDLDANLTDFEKAELNAYQSLVNGPLQDALVIHRNEVLLLASLFYELLVVAYHVD